MASLNSTSLIAPCGINCGVCAAHLRKKNTCSGCRGDHPKEGVYFLRCKIKNCEVFQEGKAKFCFECDSFPCKPLKHLDKRYRTKYATSMIANLENIRQFGIRKFVASEKARWICSECGGTICVHKQRCNRCGKISISSQ